MVGEGKMKVLSLLVAMLIPFTYMDIVLAETVRLSVPCPDTQSQDDNGLAIAAVINTWEGNNPDREIVSINMQTIYSKTNSRAIFAKAMFTGVLITHRPKTVIVTGPVISQK